MVNVVYSRSTTRKARLSSMSSSLSLVHPSLVVDSHHVSLPTSIQCTKQSKESQTVLLWTRAIAVPI